MMKNVLYGVFTIVIFSYCSSKNSNSISENKAVNPTFADKIELEDLSGNAVDLTSFKGKSIVLNIWATWCKPCIEEFPSMQLMQSKMDNSKYEFLFASSEDRERILNFKNKRGFDLNFVKLNTAPESLGIFSLPITFIINDAGELVLTQNGSKDWNTPESINEIISLTK